jgi:MFS family permease
LNTGQVLRNRSFARLFFAGAASVSGFSIGQVAINYLVFTSTHSSIDQALTGVAFMTAVVGLSLFGGTLADRRDRRVLMIVSDAVRAGSLALAAVALLFFGFNLWLVVAASFVLGAFSAIFQPAERAVIPSILDKEQLADANGLTQLTTSLAQALSNALGGALVVAVGAVLAIGLNSVTFLASGILIATIAIRKAPAAAVDANAPVQERPSFVSDTMEGVRYLLHSRGLLLLTISAGLLNLFFGMMSPYFVWYTSQSLHGDAITYGIFLALFALGAAPGALLVGRTGAIRRAGLVWLACGACDGALVLVLVAFPIQIVAYCTIFLFGFVLGFSNTTWLSAVQVMVPNEMQGRYFGIDSLGSFAVIPLGQVIGGLAIAAFGLSWTYAAAGGGFVVVSLAFLAFPELRRLGYSSVSTARAPDAAAVA